MRKKPGLWAFPAFLRDRFTVALRQPITIVATGQATPWRYFAHRPSGCKGGRTWDFWKRVAGPTRFRLRNEGVGEHVRTRFHLGPSGNLSRGTGEIANHLRSAPNEESLFLLPDPFGGANPFEVEIQPFDLMSRRHPLSSTRASLQIRLPERKQEVRRLV